ncbi:unnamed protein product [Phaeothamnion confervicola]
MTTFVNHHAFREDVLVSDKPGPPVKYVVANTFSWRLAAYIARIVVEYPPGDVMILFPSLKNNSLAKEITEKLLKFRMAVWIGMKAEDMITDKDTMSNKVVITTFHQAKGSERRLVIVGMFDGSYHEFYAPNADKTRSTDAMNVALTRASEQLVVIRSSSEAAFPTVDHDTLESDVEMCILNSPVVRKRTSQRTKRARSVTDALSFAPAHTKKRVLGHLSVEDVPSHESGQSETLELTHSKITTNFGGRAISENV